MAARFAGLLALAVVFVLAALAQCQPSAGPAVSESALESVVVDRVWLGVDNRTLLVLTLDNQIWRSTDAGKTWNRQTDLLPTGGGSQAVPVTLIDHPTDLTKAIVLGSKQQHWITSDSGASYQLIAQLNVKLDPLPVCGVDTSDDTCWPIKFHPTDSNLVLVTLRMDTCPAQATFEACHSLYFTTDLFTTLHGPVASGVISADWVASSRFTGVPPLAMWATVAMPPGQQDKYRTALVRTEDGFMTNRTVVPHGAHFAALPGFVFVEKEEGSRISLSVSPDGVTFRDADLGSYTTQYGYYILDTSEGSVFLHVMGSARYSAVGDVLQSDGSGSRYALSLRRNTRLDQYSLVDFLKVKGLQGIYLANVDTQAGDAQRKTAAVQTRITFNKGASWAPIPAPATMLDGSPSDCKLADGCALHLHGETSIYHSAFYSAESAPGILLASGNTGQLLNTRTGAVSVFGSRDAGLTWRQVADKDCVFEFGDHGGIVVLVPAEGTTPTDTLRFSWDDGETWTDFKFTDKPIFVDSIVTEPQAASQVFLIFGVRPEQSRTAGVVVQLDFAAMGKRSCTGADTPGLASSDYEFWTPSNMQNGKCLLGHTAQLTRRKAGANCYNPVQLERRVVLSNCTCTEQDWECDVGFERSTVGTDGTLGACVPQPGFNASALREPPASCQPGEEYAVSNGYRLVPGDTCQDGVQHSPTMLPCPSPAPVVPGGAAGVVVVVLLVLLLVVLCGVAYYKRESILEWLAMLRLPSRSGGSGGVRYSSLYDQDGADTSLMGADDSPRAGGGFEIGTNDVDEDAAVISYTDLQRAARTVTRPASDAAVGATGTAAAPPAAPGAASVAGIGAALEGARPRVSVPKLPIPPPRGTAPTSATTAASATATSTDATGSVPAGDAIVDLSTEP